MVEGFSQKNILIVGLGLMGGSIAKALKGKDVGAVWAVDTDSHVISQAKIDGVISEGFAGADEAVRKADFTAVCLYPELAVRFINENMDKFKSGSVITDICGVKKPMSEGIKLMRDDIDFVPAHPMAGSERQGYECSFSSLFEGCNYIITQLKSNSQKSVEEVAAFAKLLGAKNIVHSTPEAHDEYIAYTSQIPHALAVAYMHSSKGRNVLPYAGGSFRDVSRVALINEVMWAELFGENEKKLTKELDALQAELKKITGLIKNGDRDALREYMKQGREIKENYDAEHNG